MNLKISELKISLWNNYGRFKLIIVFKKKHLYWFEDETLKLAWDMFIPHTYSIENYVCDIATGFETTWWILASENNRLCVSGRRLDSSLLGANLVVSCAGLRGTKGVPKDDTGPGSKDRYIVASLRSQLRQAGNRARPRFGFLELCTRSSG